MISFIAQLTSKIFAQLCEILFAFFWLFQGMKRRGVQGKMLRVIYTQFELNDLAMSENMNIYMDI